ncbi:MAG: glycoside hydrolase family 3 C-terminal domain-containing protein [Angelakisella sp.]
MDIKNLVAQMTLEEKAGLCSGLDFWHTKPVERLGIPSVMVSDGPHGLRKQDDKADHLGQNDSIKAVCFPTGCATASSFDRKLFATLGEALGDECQAEDVSVLLGPAINIKRSPLCGRNFEYLSEDPYLAGESSAAYTNAIQAKGVGVSVKHYAANNQEHRRMSSSSEIDERTLREIYLAPFETTVRKAKPWTVMCSYNRINGTFSAENRWLLTDVLRDEWGFDGYVMTDWGAVVDRVTGIEAGLDLEMPASGGVNDRKIVAAVKAGKLDEGLLDLACERILTVNNRYLAGRTGKTDWDRDAHDALSSSLAEQCMVLLRNEDNILPLNKGDTVTFIGEFATAPRFQGGGSSHINSHRVTSALAAVEQSGIANVTYVRGYDLVADSTSDALLHEAATAAGSAKVAVVFVGLPDVYESEGYDRTHLRLPDSQVAVIEAVTAVNPNTVVVLHNGSPVEMPWLGKVKGVLEAYLGGQAVGRAVVRILYGDANPSGRLAETFPLKLADNPSYLFFGGEKDRVEYREGVFVGYRYYDKKQMEVLFPFGYGLSYTTFDYSNLCLSADAIDDTQTVTVSVDVTNTGSRSGREVVQLYVADLESTTIRPVRELKGFDKVELAAGETKTVTFTLNKRSFAYYETAIHDWYVESGDFALQIGRSSRDIVLEKVIHVNSTVELPIHFDINSIFEDLMASPKGRAVLDGPAKQIINAIAPTPEDDSASDVARAAISPEMMEAMLRYMPLRALLSFGGGAITDEILQQMLDAINR